MPASITGFLTEWLAVGSVRGIAEVALWNTGANFRLCHRSDLEKFGPNAEATPTHHRPVDARQLAKLDALGKFRPLKSKPSLPAGWLLELAND